MGIAIPIEIAIEMIIIEMIEIKTHVMWFQETELERMLVRELPQGMETIGIQVQDNHLQAIKEPDQVYKDLIAAHKSIARL